MTKADVKPNFTNLEPIINILIIADLGGLIVFSIGYKYFRFIAQGLRNKSNMLYL
jgi:hypothetical protein